MDEFRLIGPADAYDGFTLVTPAISPIFGQNPGFQIIEHNAAGRLLDRDTYYLANLDDRRRRRAAGLEDRIRLRCPMEPPWHRPADPYRAEPSPRHRRGGPRPLDLDLPRRQARPLASQARRAKPAGGDLSRLLSTELGDRHRGVPAVLLRRGGAVACRNALRLRRSRDDRRGFDIEAAIRADREMVPHDGGRRQSARPLEELLHLGEEALALRVALGVDSPPPRTPPAARAARRVRFCGVSTATWMYMSPRAALRSTEKPLPRSRNWSPVWVPAGIFTRALPPSIDGTSTSPPSAACVMRSGTRTEDVGAVALEDRVRPDADMRRRGRPAARPAPPGLALAREPDAGAVLDARRDRDLQGALALHRAGALADLAGVLDDPAGAAAGRAGPLDQEEALLRPHLAGAAAGRAGLGRRASLSSEPVPLQASHADAGRHAQLHLGAGERLREVDLDLRAEIGAAARGRAAARAGRP